MRQQHHSQSANTVPRMEASWIAALISNLDRHAQLLDQDIAGEEERAQVFDRSHPAYPTLARTLAARRDNLSATIAALEKRLASFQALCRV
jgi:flagellar protein FliJ